MALDREPKYPSRRTYVVMVRVDATADAPAGRLENLVTGRHIDFASGRELIDWIAADLDGSGEQRSVGQSAPTR
jgi:hypothetical protein